MSESQLATTQAQLVLPDVLSVIERAAKDPTIDIDKMERLLAMAERMEQRSSVQQFNAAFSNMQSALPTIIATSVIPNRGKYERFEDVMRQIQAALTAHGFSVSFDQEADEKRIRVTCHLRHIGGHSTSNAFSCRLGGRSDSATQEDCKASTTAKRNALLQALNIVIRQDVYQNEDDPHNEGEAVTQEQADTLRELCDDTKSNREKFLEFAEAKTFEEIASTRFNDLVAMLNRKRSK